MLLIAAGAVATVATMSFANETIAYKYDAKGRLVQVLHNGSVNANLISNYTFDDADNRVRVKTTGAQTPP